VKAGRQAGTDEFAAADVVAGALGGRWESRDGKDDRPGMHDFDVILPDGRCIALEATSAIAGAVVAADCHNSSTSSDRLGHNSATRRK
jgi:hypothetical protein